MGDEWLSATEAASILGVSVRQVQRLAKQGKLGYRTEARKMQIAAADVALRQRRDPSRPAAPAEMVPAEVSAMLERQAVRLEAYAMRAAAAETERDLLSRRVRDLEAALAYAQRPWWRRLFGKRRDLAPHTTDQSRDIESQPDDQSRDRRDVES